MVNLDKKLDVSISRSSLRDFPRLFVRNRAALVGLVLWVLIVIMAIIGPTLYTTDPYDIVWEPMSPPGGAFLLGTDYLGRDISAGIIHGARVTLMIGFAAALWTVFIGITIGALAGFFGSRIDLLLMRFTEFFQVLPPLLLAMVLVTLFSPNITTIVIAIGFSSWTTVARLTRAEFLKIKEQDFIMASRALGAVNRRIIWHEIMPNTLPTLIVISTLTIGVAILFEAGLSYLGLGDPNVMSWGQMIGSSRDYIWNSWWAVTFPGLAIFLTVFSVSLIGDGLNDALNPRLKQR